MRVIWAGTFDPDFSRNRKLARLMELAGVEATIVRESLWDSDRIGAATQGRLRTALRALTAYPKLLLRLLVAPRPDLYLVSYPGWFDVPVVWIARCVKRRPLVFDPFISLYDTLISDRRLHSPESLTARLARGVDRLSLSIADCVLADTPPQLTFYDRLSPGVQQRGHVLPVGADDRVFTSSPPAAAEPDLVEFHGSFVPLQGVATIAEAAVILAERGIRMVIVGDGQERPLLEKVIERTGVKVELPGIVPLDELPRYIGSAAVCLGIFGSSEKAGRVVPHKLYESLALGRPVVTREGPATRSMFEEGELITVPPADPEALAEAVRGLLDDPDLRRRVAGLGHAAYRERFHETSLAETLALALEAASQLFRRSRTAK